MKKTTHSVRAITNVSEVPGDYVSIYKVWPGLEGNNVRNWAFAGRFKASPMKLVTTVGGRGGAIYVQREEAAQMVLERRAKLARIGAGKVSEAIVITTPPPVQGRLLFDTTPKLEDGTPELLTPAGSPPDGFNVIRLLEYQNRTLGEVLRTLKDLSAAFNAAWSPTAGGAK
ncbi:MAG: hypothetical protein NTX27_20775 [Verrucomicrobia bacterium]|nr:hypothetical protein [Verrucomicrobiota bacterium]